MERRSRTGAESISESFCNEESEPETRQDQQTLYKKICSQLKVMPISRVERSIQSEHLQLTGRLMAEKEIRALAVLLVNNQTITHLTLSQNRISSAGSVCLAQTLTENSLITHLDLSDNPLGDDGVAALSKVISSHETLQYLDFSGVSCSNTGLEAIKDMLDANLKLKDLKLRNNNIDDSGCRWISKAIAENDTLDSLDLSWNHIRADGAAVIAKGLQENRGLERLTLAWNGVGCQGCVALAQALTINKTLKELDLSANRITSSGLVTLAAGLRKNRSLHTLKINHNPISKDDVAVLFELFKDPDNCALNYVEMKDIPITQKFEDALKSLTRHVTVVHAPTITHSANNKEKYELPLLRAKDLMLKIVAEHGTQVLDKFIRVENTAGWAMNSKEFAQYLVELNLNISRDLIDQLVRELQPSQAQIDLRQFVRIARQAKEEILERSF